MITDIHSEDRLVQKTFADYLHDKHGWESVYAYNNETFGPQSMLGRTSERDAVLVRDLRGAIALLNPTLPESARVQAVQQLTQFDFARSLVQHNRDFYRSIRDGIAVQWRDTFGDIQYAAARVIDFRNLTNNRFLAVRELKLQGLRVPHYNRRADLVCYVNGLPLVVIELKAVYHNIRRGFDDNLTDYLSETSIQHAFHHNAFLIVSNGDEAKYGSVTSGWEHFAEWKRNDERDAGSLDAQRLLDGMLAKDRLLGIVENFILFDESKPGGTRKIIARNHQVLGVNNAVASVERQEMLKKKFPPEERLTYRIATIEPKEPKTVAIAELPEAESIEARELSKIIKLPLIERAHPDLGRLGVFWHTQGSGKSYSMTFFAEKVRRTVPGNFTFLVMTDREDLDDQIWRTFSGTGVIDENTPRASSGKELKRLLTENHRYIFSLIHKFNQDVDPREPYSRRDDIVVISDEAHRTQAGRFARNMRLALPNASFIGFTGTPLFKHDELTKRIFGNYVSRYDFKRSEDDHSTVKLVYENRGEKLGIARLDLNDRIAEAVAAANLNPDETALLEKLLGKDYEVITADDRLDKLADDFVEHCTARWQCGKSMLVCIDKITCARMFQRIQPRWQAKLDQVQARAAEIEAKLAAATEPDAQEQLGTQLERLSGQAQWLESTIIEIIISEAQNETRDFAKWNFNIIPHRETMKRGFDTADGKRVDVEDAFKDPEHSFRVAIVCAMWLTGFDVECLQTLYIDKPMKAHTLMQAIARANRVYPGKDCGVIVDYNGMLKSLREALAQYALGDDEEGKDGQEEIVQPIEEYLASLIQAIETTENHLRSLGFDPSRLIGTHGFTRIHALRDACDALYTSDEAKRRFEIMARHVFACFNAVLMEPSAFQYAERRDSIEAIYKKLESRRDTSDVTALLKELHRIVNEAIRTQGAGTDHAEGLKVDLSKIDFAKLRDEFASKVRRKHAALQDIRDVVEHKLAAMMARNPQLMDYYKKYQDIIADYNREKDRVAVEETFRRLMELAQGLDDYERRVVEEGLTEDQLALFDMIFRPDITKADRERLKQASRSILAAIQEKLATLDRWIEKSQTQADVEMFILDKIFEVLPRPPYTEDDAETIARTVYDYVFNRTLSGLPFDTAT